MAEVAAESLGCRAEQLLVCSTGVIGRPLPMEVIEPGIRTAAQRLSSTTQALDHAAHAILTTDTQIKVSTRLLNVGGNDIRFIVLAELRPRTWLDSKSFEASIDLGFTIHR